MLSNTFFPDARATPHTGVNFACAATYSQVLLCGMGIMALCFRQGRLERDLERSKLQNTQKMAVNDSWMPGAPVL